MGIFAGERRRLAFFAAILLAVLALSASPASAETTLDVTTPADGRYQPGRVTPLLVTIEADRAVSGTLTAVFDGFNAGSQRVDVPGGSAKEIVFPVAIPPWGGAAAVTFTGDDPDDNARASINLLPAGGDELVAVLPELAARELPATAGLTTDIGVARLIPLDVELLDAGSDVLSPFTQVLGTGDDLRALEGPRLETIESWVGSQGGLLLIDEDLGTSIPLDLDAAPVADSVSDSGDSGRVDYGLGQVRFTGEAFASRGFDGRISATPTRALDEFPWGGGFGGGFPSTMVLASDAGVRIPAIGSIVLMLVAYTLVAGPLLWFVLRRSRREPLLWLILPAFALVTTALVYGFGQAIRDDTSTAHGTLLADLPNERIVSTQVLVTAPNGGVAGVELGDGWRPVQNTSEQMFFEGPWGQASTPQPILEGNALSIDLPPGGVGVVAARVSEDVVTPSWSYELEPDDDNLVGSVTNLTPHDLEEVYVVSGNGFERIREIGAGESAEVSLRNISQPPLNGDPLMDQLWRLEGFDGDAGGVVHPGVLTDWLAAHPELRSPGFVVIVGWTRDEAGPLRTTSGFEVTAGRTGFLTAARLDNDLIDASRGRVEFLRGWNSTRVEDDPGNACTDFPTTLRITPAPEVLDGDVVLAVSTRAIAGLDVWNGAVWEPAGLANAPAGDLAIAMPETALVDGSITIRAQMSCDFWGMSDPFPSVRAPDGDEPVLALGTFGTDDPDDGPATTTTATTAPPPPSDEDAATTTGPAASGGSEEG